ncbi:hypothetical protein OG563_07065 [Nocardia vinacea]|uniref:DUF3592 domain-containing protein n=1 Tax=Nocardia vinacea TaxID=96468 RepID=A0ABZ1YXE5_9NOCA|nr:hypothetical protein [Nocardia vinacea]
MLGLLAGWVACALFGWVCGVAYWHVLVPFGEVFGRSAPSYTRRRMAKAVAHTCKRDHEPTLCPCLRWQQRTVLEYQGADWRGRRAAVAGWYLLGSEVPVRISYRTNRAYPLTRAAVIRTSVLGAALGTAIGLIQVLLLLVVLHAR